MKPLLPAIDVAGQLREVAFALLLTRRRAIDAATLGAAIGIPTNDAAVAIAELAAAGWMDLDDDGRVVGAAGLSLTEGRHRLAIGGAMFRNWCVYDSLGIAGALSADATVETSCGQCGAPIRVATVRGLPERAGPERLWLAEGGTDLRASFCTPTVLLCSDEHARAWSDGQDGRGRTLDLVEAAEIGAAEWAGCAHAAERMS